MRVTRAYIAGFGTAGSLLAAASVLFVMATAVVSYRGWPQVSYAASAPALVLPRTPIYGVVPTPATTPVLTAEVTPSAPSRTGSPVGVTRTASAITPTRSQAGVTLAPGAGHGAPNHPASNVPTKVPVTTAGGSPSCTGSACAPRSSTGGGLAGVTSGVTGVVGAGVSAAGQNLGSTVSAVSGALANKLSSVSPTVGSLVSGAGQALGKAVSNATGTLGGAVAGTGQVLSGVLGGLGGQH